MQNEKCFIICIYCSPSQNLDDFKNLCITCAVLFKEIDDKFQSLPGILIFITQDGGKMKLEIQHVKKVTLW